MESGRVNHGGGAFAKVVQKTLVRTKTKVGNRIESKSIVKLIQWYDLGNHST